MFASAPRTAALPAVFALVCIGLTASPSDAQNPPPAFTWRTDYNAARKEATERGLPLLIVVGSDNCFYCRKLEGSTLLDRRVTALLGGHFVPVKINATRQPALASALKVQGYPTTVLAAPDGKILGFLEGYEEAEPYAAAMYLTLAETLQKEGKEADALTCLERVQKLAPNSRYAEVAQGKATALRKANPATLTGSVKP